MTSGPQGAAIQWSRLDSRISELRVAVVVALGGLSMSEVEDEDEAVIDMPSGTPLDSTAVDTLKEESLGEDRINKLHCYF